MALLMRLTGARNAIEVGVFTGYSSLAVAMALPEDGRIVACDISEEYTAVARRYWKEAGVEHKIDLRIAAGARNAARADRAGAARHASISRSSTPTRPIIPITTNARWSCCGRAGLIMIDNVSVVRPRGRSEGNDADTVALRAFNEKVHAIRACFSACCR